MQPGGDLQGERLIAPRHRGCSSLLTTCGLRIDPQVRKKRYYKRTSSGNWGAVSWAQTWVAQPVMVPDIDGNCLFTEQDAIKPCEKLAYKRQLASGARAQY